MNGGAETAWSGRGGGGVWWAGGAASGWGGSGGAAGAGDVRGWGVQGWLGAGSGGDDAGPARKVSNSFSSDEDEALRSISSDIAKIKFGGRRKRKAPEVVGLF